MRKIFHGGSVEIVHPDVNSGRTGLDFGRGFYVTELKEQAEKWAERAARQRKENPKVSEYDFDFANAVAKYRYLSFETYDMEWLQFIVSCRGGYNPAVDYDFVEGGVANDRVIDTVEGYINGTIDAENALLELSRHRPNHQICFLNQELIDEFVTFVNAY